VDLENFSARLAKSRDLRLSPALVLAWLNPMGLLAALDLHKDLQTGGLRKYVEVEYRLYSWGGIFPPFLGDREHSLAARFILTEFPFKLFSSSTPYDDPLPQKLCLTFRTPYEERSHSEYFHLSGLFYHEIAKEFAAFLSLVTRRRVFIGRLMRYNGLPIEHEAELHGRTSIQETQRLKEIRPEEIYRLLSKLQSMDRHIANGFMLAMRLYHSAVDMIFAEPEFSYLLLVTSIEAISSVVCGKYRPDNVETFFDSRFPGWRDISNALRTEQEPKLEEVLLGGQDFALGKLRKFVKENVPNRFWSEKEDDAKPDYLSRVIGPGPGGLGREEISRSDITIREWESIEEGNLMKVLGDIYAARSSLIHEGIRLPASIVIGHTRGIPIEALQEIAKATIEENGTRKAPKTLPIPPLLTFERLVAYSMVEFLSKQRVACP
jgi:hypothetical protein